MRVLMIAPTPFFAHRGCHVRIYEEIKALQNRGVKVALCTYHHGGNLPDVEVFRIFNIPWYKKLGAGPSLHKFYVDPILLGKCLLTIDYFKPDLLHCHLHEGALIGLICRWFKRVPVIFDMQGSLTDELFAHNFLGGDKVVLGIMKFAEKEIVRRVDWIFASSAKGARFSIEEFGIDENRISIIPDGVDVNMFKPVNDKLKFRESLGLPLDKKIVVYLGVLSHYQGIDILLETIRIIKNQRKDIYFLIMGYPNVNYYRSKAEKMGIEDIANFTGKIPYTIAPAWLGVGDVAVSPKISETEANGKILNYMAVGLPTVVFDNPVNRSLLGELGIYADKDPQSLAQKIMITVDAGPSNVQLGTKLRERVTDLFSWGKIINEVMGCYQKILNRRENE